MYVSGLPNQNEFLRHIYLLSSTLNLTVQIVCRDNLSKTTILLISLGIGLGVAAVTTILSIFVFLPLIKNMKGNLALDVNPRYDIYLVLSYIYVSRKRFRGTKQNKNQRLHSVNE